MVILIYCTWLLVEKNFLCIIINIGHDIHLALSFKKSFRDSGISKIEGAITAFAHWVFRCAWRTRTVATVE
jgi:hypothetical protein